MDLRSNLGKERYAAFFEKASLLKHDSAELKSGTEVCLYDHFSSIEAGRKMLSVASAEQRRKRQLNFFNESIAARQRLGQGKHDRGESVLFADGIFEKQDDLQGLGFHMPGHIKTLSLLHKTIHAGEVWDVSVRGDAWGLDDMEELYNVVNVGELIIQPGGRLIVQGNVFALVCQKLICPPFNDDAAQKAAPCPYQIGILPTPFSVDMKSGDLNGVSGKPGSDGIAGQDGREAEIASSLLGPRLVQPITQTDMQGGAGTNGEDGVTGGDGRNGGMCKIAEITIFELVGDLNVFVQAGEGGFGGDGGQGGKGGDGGHGANGQLLLDGYLAPGQGGAGGTGGKGGKGGNGGNGGLASNIYINVAQEAEKQVHCLSLPSQGGFGGMGGTRGRNGIQGRPGVMAEHFSRPLEQSNASLPYDRSNIKIGTDLVSEADLAIGDLHKLSNFADAEPGSQYQQGGKRGFRGRSRPAAWVFVNEVKR